MKKYSSYEDFERDEYLRVKSFYENLEDIMEDELFNDDDKRDGATLNVRDVVDELEF